MCEETQAGTGDRTAQKAMQTSGRTKRYPLILADDCVFNMLSLPRAGRPDSEFEFVLDKLVEGGEKQGVGASKPVLPL